MVKKYRVIPFVFRWHTFADAINQKIVDGGFTETDIAAVSGISATEINGLRRAMFRNMQLKTLLAVCNALDLDPREFWELEG